MTSTPTSGQSVCKTTLSPIKKALGKAHALLLWAFTSLLCHPALAALPTMPSPGTDMKGQAVANGDWLGTISAWFKSGIGILGLVLVGFGFIYVVSGGLSKWKDYSRGKAEMSDLKEYFIMGVVMMVFLVAMVTWAFSTIGET